MAASLKREHGFTLIEILMVVMLVAIVAAVAMPQFIDFRASAKDAATQSALGAFRAAITNQYTQIKVRCSSSGPTWPTTAQINANDITTGANPCTTTQVPTASDRAFFANGVIPDNPWGGASPRNTVTACVGAATGCLRNSGFACNGAAYNATSTGWCYSTSTGQIWANSQNSTGSAKESSF